MSRENSLLATPAQEAVFLELMDDVEGLVSPPDICMQLFDLIHSTDTGIKEISNIVSVDPNLTARILRIANSSFFNLSRKIDTVSRAVNVIGTNELYQLVLSISVVKSFSNIPGELVKMETFWRHSVYTAVLSRSLATYANVLHPERLFVAGLLHDLGSLVLYHQKSDEISELLLVADGDEEVMYQAEMDTFGFSHAHIAAHLLQKWRVPKNLLEAVRWHHQPDQARDASMDAHILFIANQLVNGSDQGNFMAAPKDNIQISSDMLREIGLDEEQLLLAFEAAAEQFPSVMIAFE